jgi:hypothetical protein
MSNDNLFKVAGVSTVKGNYKVRFANDLSRVKVLIKTGHTDIELVDLPSAMSKADAVTYLKTTSLMEKEVFQQAIETADAKYNAQPTVKITTAKPSLNAIRERGKKTTESTEASEA